MASRSPGRKTLDGAHRADVTATIFTPDGKGLLSTSMDGLVILWDVESGKEIRRMTHTGGVNIHGADGYDPNQPVPTLDLGDSISGLVNHFSEYTPVE